MNMLLNFVAEYLQHYKGKSIINQSEAYKTRYYDKTLFIKTSTTYMITSTCNYIQKRKRPVNSTKTNTSLHLDIFTAKKTSYNYTPIKKQRLHMECQY